MSNYTIHLFVSEYGAPALLVREIFDRFFLEGKKSFYLKERVLAGNKISRKNIRGFLSARF